MYPHKHIRTPMQRQLTAHRCPAAAARQVSSYQTATGTASQWCASCCVSCARRRCHWSRSQRPPPQQQQQQQFRPPLGWYQGSRLACCPACRPAVRATVPRGRGDRCRIASGRGRRKRGRAIESASSWSTSCCCSAAAAAQRGDAAMRRRVRRIAQRAAAAAGRDRRPQST